MMTAQTRDRLGIAIVGCGFVADLYMGDLPAHPQLELLGAMDRSPERAGAFSAYHGVPVYASLGRLLDDRNVQIVLNLTNPRSHYEVTRACLEAGKHVYSEKPLATRLDQARELVELAEKKSLLLSSAPCSLLGRTARTILHVLSDNRIGKVYLVYAEMDDGLVHRMPYRQWFSASGAPWPWKDEFEVGCTLEHAGYVLSWLPAFFGPAELVSGFASCQIPDKRTDVPLEQIAPDFSAACIRFASGVVARLTCSIIAPHDHSLRIVGEEGVLEVKDVWDYCSPVRIRRRINIRRRTIMIPWGRKCPLVADAAPSPRRRGAARMDFCRGVADLADAVRHGRLPRLHARYCLHVNEMVLAIQNAGDGSGPYRMTTTFEGMPLQAGS